MSPVLLNPHRFGGGGGGGDYPSEVMADSPLMYLRFGEASGTTAADASGNGRDGTYINTPTLGSTGLLTSDPSATSVTLDGSSEGIDSVGSAAWLNQTTFSIEALVKPSGLSGTDVIACRQDAATWTFRFEGNQLKLYNWDAANNLQAALVASGTYSINTRYHVVATFAASGTRKIYVNGAEVATAAASTLPSNNFILRIGRSIGGEHFAGAMQELAYYGTQLSAARIAAHYAAV